MKHFLLSLALLALAACGVHHTFDEMKSEPVTGQVSVVYTVTMDYGALDAYFEAICAEDPNPEACKAQRLTEFFAALAAAAPGAQIPGPSPTPSESPEPTVSPTPTPAPSPVYDCVRWTKKGRCVKWVLVDE